MPRICLFCFKVVLWVLLCSGICMPMQAAIVDTPVIAANKIDSTLTKDSTQQIPKAPSKWLQWKPTAYFVGADVAKAAYNFADTSKFRLEFVAEAFLKNTNWLTINIGITNAKFASEALQYNSQSSGVLVSMSKSLFPFINTKEMDNAFVGIGYGIAANTMSEATYTIKDIWGENIGTIPTSSKIAHFAELNLGFRLALNSKLMASWRIQGKALLNNKSFTSIKPIYIANYGSGDASTSFGYNFVLTYRIK
jgi:hypothetical protein